MYDITILYIKRIKKKYTKIQKYKNIKIYVLYDDNENLLVFSPPQIFKKREIKNNKIKNKKKIKKKKNLLLFSMISMNFSFFLRSLNNKFFPIMSKKKSVF